MDELTLDGWISTRDYLAGMLEGAEIAREQGPHGTPEEDHAIGVRDALKAALEAVNAVIEHERKAA